MAHRDYPVIIERMDPEDGSGFVAYAPDLLGCMSDGETYAEAAARIQLSACAGSGAGCPG
jgi:antitoxin HicB